MGRTCKEGENKQKELSFCMRASVYGGRKKFFGMKRNTRDKGVINCRLPQFPSLLFSLKKNYGKEICNNRKTTTLPGRGTHTKENIQAAGLEAELPHMTLPHLPTEASSHTTQLTVFIPGNTIRKLQDKVCIC
jgi:hypothetical protein